MSSLSLAGRIARVAASGMLFSVLANAMIYGGQIVIARQLLRSDYATFSVIVSVVSLIGMFVDLGWTPHLIKRFAEAESDVLLGHADRRGALLGTGLLLKIGLGIVSSMIGVAVAYVLYDASTAYLVLIGTATFLFSSRIVAIRTVMESFVRAEGDFDKVLKYSALDALAFALLLLSWSQLGLSLVAVVTIYSFCHIPGFVLLTRYLRKVIARSKIQLSFDVSVAKDLFVRAFPLTLGICFLAIHNMADPLILKELSNDHQVSAFAASFRVMAGLAFLPTLAVGVVIPEFVKLLKQGEGDRASRLSHLSLQTLLTGAIFIALLITSLAPILIDVLLGKQYADAWQLVIIFGWMFIPVVFASLFLELGIAVGRPRMFGYYTLTLAIVTVVGDLLVARPYGALGVILVKSLAIICGCIVLVGLGMKDHALRATIRRVKWGMNLLSLAMPVALILVMTNLHVPTILAGIATAILFLLFSIRTRLIEIDRIVSIMRSLIVREA